MKQKFLELLNLFKRGVKSKNLFTFDFAFLMMEFHLNSGAHVIIEYDNGAKEIKNLKDLAELKKEIFKMAVEDKEIVKELKKIYKEVEP